MNNESNEFSILLEKANEESFRYSLPKINVDIFLLAICKTKCEANTLLSFFVSTDLLANTIERKYLSKEIHLDTLPVDKLQADDELLLIQQTAHNEYNNLKYNDEFSSKYYLLAILLEEKIETCKFLNSNGITYQQILDLIKTSKNTVQKSFANESKTKQQQTVLDLYGTNLNELAKQNKIKPVIGREKEIKQIIEILAMKEKNNPMLIGEPGVGKTALAESLAIKIVSKNIYPAFYDKVVYLLSVNNLVAGTKYRGQFEERMKAIISELIKNPDYILFIDEIHTIISAGDSENGLDMANVLKPALARGEIQCIGATTLKEYKRIEKDAALERRFKTVLIEEPTKDETFLILDKLQNYYGEFHNVQYTQEALKACVNLSDRYVFNRVFPDKAMDLMDGSGAIVKLKKIKLPAEIQLLETQIAALQTELAIQTKNQNFDKCIEIKKERTELENKMANILNEFKLNLKLNKPKVLISDIEETVSIQTGIDLKEISKTDSERLSNLDTDLKKIVIGQDEAIDKLTEALKRNAVGIRDVNQPIGKFIFLGPSGVGKSFSVKELAKHLFGSENAIIRFDMSEYMESHAVSKLIGAPPGYIGFEEGGQLTEKVRQKPYSIVLLDEIEKAHPNVVNLFLQILEDGCITDSLGKKTFFKNTIIIFTSNIGTSFTKGQIGFGDRNQNYKQEIQQEFEKKFSKEFINRIDDIIIFNQLTKDNNLKILDLHLKELEERLKSKNLIILLDDESKNFLLEKGFDKKYGARELKRSVQKNLENLITNNILNGTITKNDTIEIFFKDNLLEIRRK